MQRLQFIPARGRKPNPRGITNEIKYCNLSPQGDGNFADQFSVHGLALRLQFIPARGRKPLYFCLGFTPDTLQFIPARGRKPHCLDFRFAVVILQFIPVRGRKLPAIKSRRTTARIAIYPRKGTETPNLSRFGNLQHCYLSPQEDGNYLERRASLITILLQFIPARGRKLLLFPQSAPVTIAIYPRKGTETSFARSLNDLCMYCNLSPQGDGNTTSPVTFASAA